MEALDRLVEALEAEGLDTFRTGDHVQAQCPTHADQEPSLSIDWRDDTLLVFCHAGCDTGKVIGALGLSWKDLGVVERQVAEYVYTDEAGRPLYRKIRMDPKRFYQERREGSGWLLGLGNTRRVLYRLPDLIKTPEGSTVYIVEGEKDADRIISLGHRATTAGAVGGWQPEFVSYFDPFHVVIIPDRDDAGRRNADAIRTALFGRTKSVQILWPQVGKDISDHLDAGLDFGALHTYEPPEEDLSPFEPLDWETYEIPDRQWLLEPYVPKGGRVLAFGAAGTLKSLWAMWLAAHLSNEGHRVAYFSLEMPKSITVSRMRQLAHIINKANFKLFTALDLSDPILCDLIRRGLRGTDLVVIDSWTAAKPVYVTNEDVAAMDKEVFQPILADTGTTLLILDNTGHPEITDKGDKVNPDWARGASAKGDKMEVTLMFARPDEDNKYRTTLTLKKMRLDHPGVPPLEMETLRSRIEFFEVDAAGALTGKPVWPTMQVDPSDRVTTHEVKQLPHERKFYESQADKQLGRVELAELAGVDPESLEGYEV